MPKTPKKPPDIGSAIGDMVFAIRGPLIVYETTWADCIPNWIRKEITTTRLMHGMLDRRGTAGPKLASDLETVAYLFPASMVAPMGHDWSEIYLWLTAKCIRASRSLSAAAIKQADEIAPKAINTDQQRQLHGLQSWLYRRYEMEKARFRRMAIGSSGGDPEPIVGAPYEQCNLWGDQPVQKKAKKEKVHA